MILAFLLAAASPIAPPVAAWSIEGSPGAVHTVSGAVKTGGRIVADRFVSDPDLAQLEKDNLAGGDPPPKGSCRLAGSVRPFKRLRRFAANGRLLWEWNTDKDQGTAHALRFLNPGTGDCLSPDGARLIVSIYSIADGHPWLMGDGVAAVDRNPRIVPTVGKRSGEDFGTKNRTGAWGWRRGSDATLLFVFTQEEPEREDYVVLGRRP